MDKVDSVIQGILKFLKDFFQTYRDVILQPAKTFETAMNNDGKPENHLNSVPYMLLSTFFLIYTLNVQPLSKHFFDLYSPGLSDVLNTFLNAEAKQVIIVTLPVSAFVYLSTKLVAIFSGNKNINRVMMYWAGTCFITYFLSYVLLIILSGIVKFLSDQLVPIKQTKYSVFAWIIWIIIFGYWAYVVFSPFNGIRTIVKQHISKAGKKIIVYFGIAFTFTICVYVGIKQKEFDPVFNPLKLYQVKYSFVRVSGDTVISMSDIIKDKQREQGGPAGSQHDDNSEQAVEGNARPLEYPKKITIDAIVENSSPEIIILKPNSCIKFTVSTEDDLKQAKKFGPGANSFTLDMMCKDITIVGLDAIDDFNVRDRLMLFPAETQWLRLTAVIEIPEFDKLNSLYYEDSLGIKKSPVFFLELQNVNSNQGNNLTLTSKNIPLKILNFVPSKQRYDSLRVLIK